MDNSANTDLAWARRCEGLHEQGRLYIVSHQNEVQCIGCILSVGSHESNGECWALEGESKCMRCLYSGRCKKGSRTSYQLGALASKIHRTGASEDLWRVGAVIFQQHHADSLNNGNKQDPRVHGIAGIQDLIVKYSDSSDMGADSALLVLPAEEIDEKASGSGSDDETEVVMPPLTRAGITKRPSARTYKNSADERNDLLTAYVKYKG